MSSEKKANKTNRIPITFSDSEDDSGSSAADSGEFAQDVRSDEATESEAYSDVEDGVYEIDADNLDADDLEEVTGEQSASGETAGPVFAELVASRAELKRVETEIADLKDRLARRQADFENYRKRGERERGETYERVVAEIAAKLLPVLDNLKRALDTEASLEAGESDEFRHFLSGVDLIFKQLGGVIEALGVKPIAAVGERFDPHIHEAVVSEPTDEHEPDTVMEEILRGYRLGDKLIRPALVKVATKK